MTSFLIYGSAILRAIVNQVAVRKGQKVEVLDAAVGFAQRCACTRDQAIALGDTKQNAAATMAGVSKLLEFAPVNGNFVKRPLMLKYMQLITNDEKKYYKVTVVLGYVMLIAMAVLVAVTVEIQR